jgi:hypothetical protein
MSQEQLAAMNCARAALREMNIYLSGSCAAEMEERHDARARVIAAALLEARANGLISGAMFVPFPHNELLAEATRMMIEARQLREQGR